MNQIRLAIGKAHRGVILPLILCIPAAAQQAPSTSTAPTTVATTTPSNDLVTLDFPADGIEVGMLADIVTTRLKIPILYDETIKNKKVIIHVPVQVPEGALLGILQSALRLKQLALVDAEQPGWKQIVPAASLAGVANPVGGARGDGPVAQVFLLSHADPTRLTELLRPFLTQPGGYIQAESGQKTLIISDYPSVLQRVEPLIRRLDTEAPATEVRFVPLQQADATQIAPALTQLIASRETFQWGNATQSGIFLSADERSNQIAVVAPTARMPEVMELIASMDKASEQATKVYHFKSISPERFDRVLKGLLGAAAKKSYQGVIDEESQSLVVAAAPAVLRRIDQLVPELDVAVPESQNPIHFYKLKNTKAADVLATINGLLGENNDNGQQSSQASRATSQNPAEAGNAPGRMTTAPPASAAGNTAASASMSTPPVTGGAGTTTASPAALTPPSGVSIGNNSNTHYVSPALPYANAPAEAQPTGVMSMRSRNATVAADVNTNSIIVIAPPQTQQMYADLITRLDERRPQVQVECTIVTLDTSDGFTFGVDIGKLGGFDTSKLLTLSSFGISTANAANGTLAPVDATGGTFALLSPRIADLVLRALATNNRARLVSAPQLLVNDNGKGKLESVAQQPFAVILDASNVQTLTSLGGLAQAGTSITVEPHISQADYLQLSYNIELSNFTGAASNGLPPPSEKNAVDSSVTIPDGYTIVVGGLNTKNFSTTVNKIPILGDIPIVGLLFGSRSKNTSDSTLFVFIRPVILRDDKFEDLKYLSGVSLQAAGLPGDFPVSKPVAMH